MQALATHSIVAVILTAFSLAVSVRQASAEEGQRVHQAAKRAVRLIDQTSAKFLKTRKCFTCHTQTLSAMVLRDARARFEIDEQNFKRQFQRAFAMHRFTQSREPACSRVDTVGYALWALDIGRHAPDAMTEDMTWYLLNYQKELGHWETTVDRPPTEASDFTTNYVAIRGLKRFGTAEQREEIAQRTVAVEKWLEMAVAAATEDQVFRLHLAQELKMPAEKIRVFVKKLVSEQRENGGWAQKLDMQPDAYATATALVALHEAGGIKIQHPDWQRGLDYLLKTQEPDGSWHVVTRSKPRQAYFESGFPYGKDQFISTYATGWATKALLLALEE